MKATTTFLWMAYRIDKFKLDEELRKKEEQKNKYR